jgi:hypothetical protein
MLKLLKILIVLLSVSTILFSQGITISYEDYSDDYSVGKTDKGFATPMMDIVQVDIGSASSSAQVWDFSQLNYEKVQDGVFIEPSTSPCCNSFPDANVVQKVTAYGFDSYTYHKLDQSGFYMLGFGGDAAEPDVIYEGGVLNFEFPVTYGKVWEDNTTSHVMGFTNQIHYKWTADAHGTLKLPHGDFPALRIKIETTTTTNYGMGEETSTSYMVSFATEGVEAVYIQSDDSLSDGLISTQGLIYMAPGNVTSVENEVISVPDGFTLLQNYPNPFNPTTTIEFSVGQDIADSEVSLKVYDILGNEVSNLFNGIVSAGKYRVEFNAAELASGNYLYVIRNKNYSLTKKCLLIK